MVEPKIVNYVWHDAVSKYSIRYNISSSIAQLIYDRDKRQPFHYVRSHIDILRLVYDA